MCLQFLLARFVEFVSGFGHPNRRSEDGGVQTQVPMQNQGETSREKRKTYKGLSYMRAQGTILRIVKKPHHG